MGLEKVTYVDGSTVITAQNLNAIQDSIIDLEATRTVPTNVRNAIYTLLENAAYATTGLEDEIAVVEAWAEEVTSLTLSVSTLSLESDDPQVITATTVPIGATVTWSSSNNSVATVSGGVVTGVSNGSCVITASAGDLVATCDVTVEGFAELVSISAVYTQSGTVYETDSVDSLKADLVVTATYDDSSTETVPSTDYTLSGTLTVGTSTITVTYGGKTTTFNVTVSGEPWDYEWYSSSGVAPSFINYKSISFADNNEYATITINSSNVFVINDVGEMELDVKVAFPDNSYPNNPQLVVRRTARGGFKVFPQTNTQAIVTNISGSNVALNAVRAGFNIYRMVCGSNEYSLDYGTDENNLTHLVGVGQSDSNYYQNSGIIHNSAECVLELVYIKYRKL